MNANVLTFLQELLQRLFTKSPLFFKIWSIISGTFLLISGVPAFITMLNINGFHIPDLWNASVTKAVQFASSGMLLMSLLTTQSKATGVTSDGTVVKSTNEEKLPFTAATEQKSAVKNDVAPIEIKPVNN